MQPRTLQQVLTELDGVYNPQVDSIRQRQAAIPGQLQAEQDGLQAKQNTAFGDILNGARRRGTGVAFGGIPLQEQARYTADNYLPALARLQQSGREQAMSLEDALNGINERKYSQGVGIYSQEQQAAEQRRQFDAQIAESRRQAAAAAAASGASSFAPTLGGSAGQNPQKPAAAPQFIGQNDLRGRWAYQAKSGDNEAAVLLKYVGNDNVSNAIVSNKAEYDILKKYGVRGNYKPGNISNAYGASF
jgi:hypothetical protein